MIRYLDYYGAKTVVNLVLLSERDVCNLHSKTLDGMGWINDFLGYHTDDVLLAHSGCLDADL